MTARAPRMACTISGVTSPTIAPGKTKFNEVRITSTVGSISAIARDPTPTCVAPASFIAAAAALLVPNATM